MKSVFGSGLIGLMFLCLLSANLWAQEQEQIRREMEEIQSRLQEIDNEMVELKEQINPDQKQPELQKRAEHLRQEAKKLKHEFQMREKRILQMGERPDHRRREDKKRWEGDGPEQPWMDEEKRPHGPHDPHQRQQLKSLLQQKRQECQEILKQRKYAPLEEQEDMGIYLGMLRREIDGLERELGVQKPGAEERFNNPEEKERRRAEKREDRRHGQRFDDPEEKEQRRAEKREEKQQRRGEQEPKPPMLDEKVLEEFLPIIKEQHPEMFEKLMQAKEKEPRAFHKHVFGLYQQHQKLLQLKKENPALYESVTKERECENAVRQLAQEIRKIEPGEKRQAAVAKLKETLGQWFDVRQNMRRQKEIEQRQKEIERLQKELTEAEKFIQQRGESKDKIIEQYLQKLIGVEASHEW